MNLKWLLNFTYCCINITSNFRVFS